MVSRRGLLAAALASTVAPADAQVVLGSGATRNHPDLDAALQELRQRQWQALASRCAALPPQSAVVLLDDLGNAVDVDANLSGLQRVNSGRTVLGALLVGIAWRHRGSGTSETVTMEGGLRFLEKLEEAKGTLLRATQDDPGDGVAHATLFRVHKGLEDRASLERALPAFLSAARRPVAGFSFYLDAVSAKWGGSEEDALAFSRSHAAAMPPASQGLIPDAHIVNTIGRLMSTDPSVAASGETYLQQTAVGAEIVQAHERFAATPPDSDLFSALYAHSVFSFAFFQMEDLERLRPHLVSLGGYRGGPWGAIEGGSDLIQLLRVSLGITEL